MSDKGLNGVLKLFAYYYTNKDNSLDQKEVGQ